MTDVVTNFSGDAKELLAEMNKIYRENLRLREANQEAAKQSKKHHDEAMSFAKEQIHTVTGMVTGLFTVEKAIETVTEAYHGWQERIEKAGQAQKETNETMLRGIAISGQAKNAVPIQQALSSIPGLPPLEAAKAYEAARAGAPLETDWRRTVGLVGSAGAGIRGLGVGADVPQFVGRAAQVSTLFPDRSTDEIADITRLLENKLGKHADRFFGERKFPDLRKLVESGAFQSPEEALGTAVVAADRNPQLIKGYATATEKHWERPHGRSAMRTAHGRGLAALAKATSAEERGRIIRENPEAAAAAGLEGIEKFPWEMGTEVGQSLTNQHGVLSQEARDLAAGRAGRQLQAAQHESDELATAKRRRGLAEIENRSDTAQKIFETHLESSGIGDGIGGAVSESLQRARWKTAVLSGYMNAPFTGRDPYYAALKGYGSGTGPNQASEYLETRNRVEGYRRFDDAGQETAAGEFADAASRHFGRPLNEAERGLLKDADEAGALDALKQGNKTAEEQRQILEELKDFFKSQVPNSGPAVINNNNERGR